MTAGRNSFRKKPLPFWVSKRYFGILLKYALLVSNELIVIFARTYGFNPLTPRQGMDPMLHNCAGVWGDLCIREGVMEV